MSRYPNVVNGMLTNSVLTNTSTYPECWDTRCRDNECQLY